VTFGTHNDVFTADTPTPFFICLTAVTRLGPRQSSDVTNNVSISSFQSPLGLTLEQTKEIKTWFAKPPSWHKVLKSTMLFEKHGEVKIFRNNRTKSNYSEQEVKSRFSSGNARYSSFTHVPLCT
jgi:hypothetical protein